MCVGGALRDSLSTGVPLYAALMRNLCLFQEINDSHVNICKTNKKISQPGNVQTSCNNL